MKAKLAMGAAMAFFGTISIFAKNAAVSSGMLSLCRGVIAIMTILAYQLISGRRINLREIKRDIPLLFLSGAAMGFNWILLFEAYSYTSVSVATLCYYFAPILVMALCPFLFHERLTAKQIACFAMSTVGIILLIDIRGGGHGSNDVFGVLLALGAALLYAAVVLINKFIKNVSGIDRTLLQFVAAVIVITPYVGLTSGFSLSEAGARGIVCIIIIGVVYTGLMYCVYFSSIGHMTGQEAMLLSYLDPLFAVIVSVAVLGEPLSAVQLLGGMLVIGFTLFNELKAREPNA